MIIKNKRMSGRMTVAIKQNEMEEVVTILDRVHLGAS